MLNVQRPPSRNISGKSHCFFQSRLRRVCDTGRGKSRMLDTILVRSRQHQHALASTALSGICQYRLTVGVFEMQQCTEASYGSAMSLHSTICSRICLSRCSATKSLPVDPENARCLVIGRFLHNLDTVPHIKL